LLDDHPLSIRIDADKRGLWPAAAWAGGRGRRRDAGRLDGDRQARNPRRFFRALTRLVLEEDHAVQRLEPLDDSAHAILGYLLGSGAPLRPLAA